MNANDANQDALPDAATRRTELTNRLNALVLRARRATADAKVLDERARKIKQMRDDCDQLAKLKMPGIQVLVGKAAARSEQQARRIHDVHADMNAQRELALVTGEAVHRRWEDLGVMAGQEFERWGEALEQMRDLDEKARAELRSRIEKGEERWGARASPGEDKPVS